MAFVKVVFLKQEGSIFNKALRFFASAVFGIICGYLTSKFYEYKWALVVSPVVTLLADQIVNKMDKSGLPEILKYIKIKIGTTDNSKNGL